MGIATALRGRVHMKRVAFHVTPSFAPGGAQVRAAQIMNHLGPDYRHAIVSLDGDFSAGARLGPATDWRPLTISRSRNPLTMALRLRRLLRSHNPDLVLTYNWGAIDAVVAATSLRLPIIHTEDGFGAEEAEGQKRRRVVFRRFALQSTYRVVAPSYLLVDIMHRIWRLPPVRVQYIPNGVDTSRFVPRLPSRNAGPAVIGTACHLRPEKRIDLLLSLFARIASAHDVQLHIAGDGPERTKLQELARELGVGNQVRFHGHQEDLPAFYSNLDIFAMTSSTEQMPLSVLEAMASGLPVVSTDVGDVRHMVSPENKPYIVTDPNAWTAAAGQLLTDITLRQGTGAANRRHCVDAFGLHTMLRQYEVLYEQACNSGSGR
jgi:glycosyltransferase involved in cell wall biosynthesis